MKKMSVIMLALMALMISVPVAMARDANSAALDKVWKDQVAQENQQKVERLKPNSESDMVVPDRTQSGTLPGLQRPSPLAQENQQKVERRKPNSESNRVVPDRTQPGTLPGLQRPSPR